MPVPNCSTVKNALTDLKEILSRSQSADAAHVFDAIAGLEATISSIEEKSFASGDITSDMGVPIITGMSQPVTF
jgi:hypothetical protein